MYCRCGHVVGCTALPPSQGGMGWVFFRLQRYNIPLAMCEIARNSVPPLTFLPPIGGLRGLFLYREALAA